MGRPIKSAETVGGTSKLASVNTALPIGSSGLGGNQIIMKGFVDGASAQVTTNIIKKVIRNLRTTAGGTQTLTLTAVVHGPLSADSAPDYWYRQCRWYILCKSKLQDVIL